MKKTFDTLFNGNLFYVGYELNENGSKRLMHLTLALGDLPINIALLFCSSKPYHEELFEHVINAMNNNAMSEGLISDGLRSRITNGYENTNVL